MKILVVNAWPPSSKNRFNDFLHCVESAAQGATQSQSYNGLFSPSTTCPITVRPAGLPELQIEVRNANDLGDYVYRRKDADKVILAVLPPCP